MLMMKSMAGMVAVVCGSALQVIAQEVKVVQPAMLQGRACIRITVPWGTLYFENHSGISGFIGVFDPEGKDWIQQNYGWATSGSAEWRGFPNATENNFGHGARSSGSTNTVTKNTATHVVINSRNATMEFNYHFFPSHGAIEVVKAGEKYCFLWEGTVGGSTETTDYHVFSDGVRRRFAAGFRNDVDDIPDEWVYCGDVKLRNRLLLGKRPDDNLKDENWVGYGTYELYSFGRGSGASGNPPWGPRTLTGTQNFCVYTFVDSSKSHAEMRRLVEGLFARPYEPYGSTTGVSPRGISSRSARRSVAGVGRPVTVVLRPDMAGQMQPHNLAGVRLNRTRTCGTIRRPLD